MLGREMPWKPSQPATKSHSSSSSAPSCAYRDARALALEVVERDVLDLEEQRAAALQARGDQVLDDLGLAVDHDRLAGQLVEGDPVALAARLQLDARVDEPLAAHALPDARPRDRAPRRRARGRPPGSAPRRTSRLRFSRTTESIPATWSSCASVRPAGPAPTIADLRPGHGVPAPRSNSAAWPCPTPTHMVAMP